MITNWVTTSISLGGNFGNGLTGDQGPFTDIQSWYWTGTEFSVNEAWDFRVFNGEQYNLDKVNGNYAWAVRDGDVAAVPLPPSILLLGLGLSILALSVKLQTKVG